MKGAVNIAEEIWTIVDTHIALTSAADMMDCVLESHGEINIFFYSHKGLCNELQLSETRKPIFLSAEIEEKCFEFWRWSQATVLIMHLGGVWKGYTVRKSYINDYAHYF